MADRMTMELVKGAARAKSEGDNAACTQLLLLAIVGLLTTDVEARAVLDEFVPGFPDQLGRAARPTGRNAEPAPHHVTYRIGGKPCV